MKPSVNARRAGALGDPDNTIGNLTLLDQETNRSYKNAVFPVKRHRVLELDAHGVFVPHCPPQRVLKSHSPQVGHTITGPKKMRMVKSDTGWNSVKNFFSFWSSARGDLAPADIVGAPRQLMLVLRRLR